MLTTTHAAKTSGGVKDDYSATAQRYHARFCNLAFRILHDRDDAEDAVQEAHLRALTHLEQFEGRAALSTWIAQIVANEALARLRRRVPWVDLDAVTLQSSARGPEEGAVDGELRTSILASVDTLPEPYRVVFSMRVVHERSAVEAAAYLGVTVGCVKVRLHRAKALLRKHLQTQFRIARNSKARAMESAQP